MKDGQPVTTRREDYRPPSHWIDRTQLRVELDEHATLVRSRLTVRRNLSGDGKSSLRLDGVALALLEVAVDGRVLSNNEYRVDDEGLDIFQLPDACEVACVTRLDPSANTSLEGLYRSGGMFCTQCEAQGFRKITYYLDRPDVMARFSTTIVADASRYPVLLANGNEVALEHLSDGRTAVTWEDPFPKPSYLFALVGGDLAMIENHFTTMSGRKVTLRIYSEVHNIGQCDYAMGALQRAMAWDETRFGREYDLDIFMIVAVDHFNMGAMENKGLNIFNTACVLARPDTTTDAGFQRVEAVIGHEYFHNWSGNRVTCRDWFQLSLKEGFTVFRDQEFSSDLGARTVKRIEDVNKLRTIQFAEDASPMAHSIRPDSYIEISNFYTPTVYEKGAEIVRMLHTLLGWPKFRSGTDLYFARHDGTAATCEDFVRALESANDIDLAQFRRWYSQAGTPQLTVTDHFDAQTGTYELRVAQAYPGAQTNPGAQVTATLPVHLPLAMGLLDADGNELCGAHSSVTVTGAHIEQGDSGSLIVHITEASHVLRFAGVTARPVASLLRQFSAPVNLRFDRPSSDLKVLMRHDSDGFARWDAAQVYYLDQVRAGLAAKQRDGEFVALVGDLLRLALVAPDDGEAKGVLADMLQLPSESFLTEQFNPVPVDELFPLREALATQLAEQLRDQWFAVYQANSQPAAYEPSPVQIARRSLKNVALSYIARLDDERAVLTLANQFDTADNMTDQSAALRAIVDFPFPRGETLRERALAAFYAQYNAEALVVDQWFALQAGSRRPDGAARVAQLEQHSAFDIKNPNKVRALYSAFANQGLASFHARDGSGYALLAERIERLNALNPQIAARLVKPLTAWRRFAAPRRELMRGQLQRLAARSDLSPDVFELVSKALV